MLSWNNETGSTWNYVKKIDDFSDCGLYVACTWRCDVTDDCINNATAQNTHYADVFFDYPNQSDATLTSYAAHEIGHTLGLAHHTGVPGASGTLMYPGSTRTTPSTSDVGNTPPCTPAGQGYNYGIRCIYNWA